MLVGSIKCDFDELACSFYTSWELSVARTAQDLDALRGL